MKVEVLEREDNVILKLDGNITGIPDESEFNTLIKKYISEKKVNIIVDLGSISYINSTGLGMILRGYITIKNSGGSFKLASLNSKLRKLLEITKLNTIIEIHDSLESALN